MRLTEPAGSIGVPAAGHRPVESFRILAGRPRAAAVASRLALHSFRVAMCGMIPGPGFKSLSDSLNISPRAAARWAVCPPPGPRVAPEGTALG